MTIHRKRLMAAGAAAFLLVCGAPGAVLAQGSTDVTLSNESEGTEVNSGESSFRNFSNVIINGQDFDPPSQGEGSTQQIVTAGPSGALQQSASQTFGSIAEPLVDEDTKATLIDAIVEAIAADSDMTPEEKEELKTALNGSIHDEATRDALIDVFIEAAAEDNDMTPEEKAALKSALSTAATSLDEAFAGLVTEFGAVVP